MMSFPGSILERQDESVPLDLRTRSRCWFGLRLWLRLGSRLAVKRTEVVFGKLPDIKEAGVCYGY
jgi:hypothetical protein